MIFSILSLITFVVALTVITVRNPVYSVLALVILFVCGALLLLLLGLDFIPLIFVVVYVGAVAVLFLFVVIILNIKLEGSSSSSLKILLGFFIFSLFAVQRLEIDLNVWAIDSENFKFFLPSEIWVENFDNVSNIQTLGNVLYTHFFIHFLLAGLILLLAIVGAIVLTSQRSRNTKNQLIFRQISRQPRVIWIRS
jgi:NADH-quinone oxidoreductase subunit J